MKIRAEKFRASFFSNLHIKEKCAIFAEKFEIMTNTQLTIEDITPIEDLNYEGVDPRYRSVQIILTALLYVLFAALALFLLLLDDILWFILAEAVIVIAMIVNLVIVSKAWTFKGYALRENDITYRSGVVFPKITTIPFSKMQQVSVKQNPVSKIFRLYSVEVVNGAQAMSSLSIPGLTNERANQIKSIVISKLKYEQD